MGEGEETSRKRKDGGGRDSGEFDQVWIQVDVWKMQVHFAVMPLEVNV
jgi:hypothetical protein